MSAGRPFREAWTVLRLSEAERQPFGLWIGERACYQVPDGCDSVLQVLRWAERSGFPVFLALEPQGADEEELASSLWHLHMGLALPLGMVHYLCRHFLLAEKLLSWGLRAYLHERVWLPGYPLWVENATPRGLLDIPRLFSQPGELFWVWEAIEFGMEVFVVSEEVKAGGFGP